MARTFAQLARNDIQKHAAINISKEPLDISPLEIRTLGNEVLRQSARRVSKFDNRLRELVRDMLRSMYTAKGIGLAAPQIGENKQILVIDIDLENPSTPPLVLINPEITFESAAIETYEEGCLSIPGVYLDVLRPSSIKLSFNDEMGRPKKMTADGLLGRCIQHEMDHLKGVLFVDRVSNQESLKKELQEHGFNSNDVRLIK